MNFLDIEYIEHYENVIKQSKEEIIRLQNIILNAQEKIDEIREKIKKDLETS